MKFKAVNIGVTDDMPFTQRKYIQVTNITCIAVSILAIGFWPMAFNSGIIPIAFHVFLPVILLICLLLNNYSYYSLSRVLVASFSILFIFFMYHMLGNQVMTYLYFFTVVAVLPMIFPPKQTKALVFFEIIALVFFTFDHYFISDALPLYFLKGEAEEMLPIIVPIFALLLTLLIMLFFREFVIRGDRLFEQENERAEQLLLNILPSNIAKRLKVGESNIVDNYANVSVMFVDIVGFTQLAQSRSPSEVVTFLNRIFSKFDTLADKFNVEKIKTIGDAYVVASGIPHQEIAHAAQLSKLALEILEWVESVECKDINISIRIGINSGPVVAGIFGDKKYIYDLWGDTVNLARQMESSGESNKIQISEHTYQLINHKFKTQYRGLITVRDSKQEKSWWLVAPKPV